MVANLALAGLTKRQSHCGTAYSPECTRWLTMFLLAVPTRMCCLRILNNLIITMPRDHDPAIPLLGRPAPIEFSIQLHRYLLSPVHHHLFLKS